VDSLSTRFRYDFGDPAFRTLIRGSGICAGIDSDPTVNAALIRSSLVFGRDPSAPAAGSIRSSATDSRLPKSIGIAWLRRNKSPHTRIGRRMSEEGQRTDVPAERLQPPFFRIEIGKRDAAVVLQDRRAVVEQERRAPW
jgi:hypothetical protein